MGHQGEPKTIDVCVCTFQRAELLHTLESLNELEEVENYDVRIIVVDNDRMPSAKALVEAFANVSKYPVTYLHGPAGNISIARNKCLEASTALLLAFVDDDEIVTGNWLKNLTLEMQKSGADVVLGPVIARYLTGAPKWLSIGDFHSTYPVWVKGEIRTGYTCNVLMNMGSPSIRGKRFNLSRGQTGGEDTEFFKHIFESGGQFSYCAEAIVREAVPENRATFAWLLKRKFRAGQTHGKLLAETLGTGSKITAAARALLKVVYCLFSFCLCLTNRPMRNKALLRGSLHVGAISGIIGFDELEQYGLSTSEEVSNEAS